MSKTRPAFSSIALLLALTILITIFPGFVYAEKQFENVTSMDSKKGPPRKPQSGFFYGLLLGYKTEIYKGVDNDYSAFPVLGYRNDKVNFLGPFISYRLMQQDALEVTTLLRYNFAGYDSSDSTFLNGMDDRDPSLDFGLGLSYKEHHWTTKFNALHDVMGSSNGFELNASLGKTFYFGPIFIEPNVSLKYWDDQYVDYYYGVNSREAIAGRDAYFGRSALNKQLGLNISTPIFFGGFTRLTFEQVWYDNSISNSPLTDSDRSFNFRMTFSRFF